MNKNTQSLVLSELFFRFVKGLEKNNKGVYPGTASYKYSVLENAYRCLSSGHSYEFLKESMLKASKEYQDSYNIEDFMNNSFGDFKVLKELTTEKDNLISPGIFYNHPLLQESRKKPAYIMDTKTMELTEAPSEPFFLEIKESFTMTDLLHYYYSSHRREPLPGTSHATQFYNLLNDFGLDKVLFLIDASVQDFHDNEQGARVPAFLPEYIDEAKSLMNSRTNLLKEGGLTRVYPRAKYLTGIEPE